MRSLFSISHWFRMCILLLYLQLRDRLLFYWIVIAIAAAAQAKQKWENLKNLNWGENFFSIELSICCRCREIPQEITMSFVKPYDIKKCIDFILMIQTRNFCNKRNFPCKNYIAIARKLLFNANIFRKYFRMHISCSFSLMNVAKHTPFIHCCTTNSGGTMVWYERVRQYFSTSSYVISSHLGISN